MLESFKIDTQGEVSIYAIEGEKKTLISVVKNALTSTAKQVIANILAKTEGAGEMSEIGLFIGTDVPANRVVRPIFSYTLIAVDRVQFDAQFEAASFTGIIAAADIASPFASFAKVTGLSITKQPTEGILVSWKIKIV